MRPPLRALALLCSLSAAHALATPPSRKVPVSDLCKASSGCYVVLLETQEKPPIVPGAEEGLRSSPLGGTLNTSPPALPPDPGGEYRFTHACSQAIGYYVVAARRTSQLTRVKIVRAFNDPELKPFEAELPPVYGPRPACSVCAMGESNCREPFTCPDEVRCLGYLPSFGSTFIAVIQRAGPRWEFSGSTWKERWTAAGIELGAPRPSNEVLVKALEASFPRKK